MSPLETPASKGGGIAFYSGVVRVSWYGASQKIGEKLTYHPFGRSPLFYKAPPPPRQAQPPKCKLTPSKIQIVEGRFLCTSTQKLQIGGRQSLFGGCQFTCWRVPIYILEAEIVFGVLYRKGVIPKKGGTLGSRERLEHKSRDSGPQRVMNESRVMRDAEMRVLIHIGGGLGVPQLSLPPVLTNSCARLRTQKFNRCVIFSFLMCGALKLFRIVRVNVLLNFVISSLF